MNPRRDPDRLIHAFLMEGATELADEVYVTVRDRIEHTRQRAVIGPWREPDVNGYLKIALAVAAVVVVAVVGFRQFGGANVAGPGSSGSPAPTATPAGPPTPAPSAAGSAPPLTETLTSDRMASRSRTRAAGRHGPRPSPGRRASRTSCRPAPTSFTTPSARAHSGSWPRRSRSAMPRLRHGPPRRSLSMTDAQRPCRSPSTEPWGSSGKPDAPGGCHDRGSRLLHLALHVRR